MVGAAILSLKEEGCFDKQTENQFSTAETQLVARMLVVWQVFDPLEKKLLFRVTTEGSAKVKMRTTQRDIVLKVTRDAFGNAAKIALSDPNFVEAVKDTRARPPSTKNGELFPEANSSAAAPASANTALIAQIPLSTKDFRQQVVTILTPGGTGSGFYIADGLLLTNHHVIAGYTDVKVRFFGGREIAAQVITSNAKRDVALVKTEVQAFHGLPLRAEPPPETSPVYVIGSPLGEKQEGSISSGIVSGFRNEADGPYIQSDVGVTHGNSGGPMFDDKGNVIALTVLGKLSDGQATQVNFFIPIADALKVLAIAPVLNAGYPPVVMSANK